MNTSIPAGSQVHKNKILLIYSGRAAESLFRHGGVHNWKGNVAVELESCKEVASMCMYLISGQ